MPHGGLRSRLPRPDTAHLPVTFPFVFIVSVVFVQHRSFSSKALSTITIPLHIIVGVLFFIFKVDGLFLRLSTPPLHSRSTSSCTTSLNLLLFPCLAISLLLKYLLYLLYFKVAFSNCFCCFYTVYSRLHSKTQWLAPVQPTYTKRRSGQDIINIIIMIMKYFSGT